MVITELDFGRIVLVSIIVLGFFVLAIYRQRDMKWLVFGYAALVVGGIVYPVATSIGFLGVWVLAPLILAASATLFFISAYKSRQRINDIAEEIEERKIPLEEDVR